MKKALSALLAAVMVLGLAAVMPITAHAATIEVADADQLIAAFAQPGDNTIRLLNNITLDYYAQGYGFYYRLVNDTAKTITLDLNGKILNVETLGVYNGGTIQLLDPANGQFNVSFDGTAAAVTANGAGSKVEVTNANYTGNTGDAVDAWGGEVTVYGNVTSTNKGVGAGYGGEVTINGTMTVPAGKTYIDLDFATKAAGEYATPTTKTGYHTYTFDSIYGTSTVWVKCNEHVGDWVVDTALTATTAGSKHRDCTACNFRETQAIPATGGGGTDPGAKYIKLWGKTTTWLDNFGNWLLVIFCFGWIWMAF
ncbi:MAG: hypothetical protein FWF60_02525 [Oscillospiraceae bacterium]|nr:hypothetical protein [Oscillospiraceae bacterium]